MTTYSDKIDASYAKLKTVLAEGASAVAGFKSSLPKKSQVLTRQLSEEVVHVLLEEIRQFVMHMTSASIDQVSGRLEEKLALLGEDGLMLSDETVQKIKDALSGIPGASSSVAQVLNGLGKDKRLGELSDFFQMALPSGSGVGVATTVTKAGEKDEDAPLLSKDAREKFAKYLDETLPKTKYFNEFFDKTFQVIDEELGKVADAWFGIQSANLDLADANMELAGAIAKVASSVAALASSNVSLAASNTALAASVLADAAATTAVAASTAALAVVNFALAVTTLVSMVSIMVTLIAATVSAVVTVAAASIALIAAVLVSAFTIAFSILALAITVIASALGVIAAIAVSAVGVIIAVLASAIGVILAVLISAVVVIISIVVAAIAAVASMLVIAVTALVVALIVAVAIVAVAAALVIAVVILAAALVIAVAAVAIAVAAVAIVVALAIAAVVLIIGIAVLAVAIVLAAAVLIAAVLAVAAILIAAAIVAVVFAIMAVVVIAVAAAVAALAVAILAVGLALAAGIAVIGIAIGYGAMALGMAVLYGVGAIFAFAFASVIAIMGMSVIAMGAFLATTYAFTGMLVAGLIGLITGVVVSLLALFLLGMLLVGKSAKEIWDYLEPYWEKMKGWWEDIKAWWDDSFIKKMLDKVDEVGGWGNFFVWLWDTAKQKIVDWFKSTKIGQWIDSVIDWWDNFSFKGLLKKFWESFKSWILEKWNGFCDWLIGINIPYPNGISYQGPDHWYSRANPFNYKISWGYWYLFEGAASWKSEVPKDEVGDIPPPDEPDSQDGKIAEEMQQAVDDGLTEQDREQISLAKNIFEQDRLRKEAIRKRREQLRNNPIVVPQTITYQNQPWYSGGGSAGLYSGTLGSGYGG